MADLIIYNTEDGKVNVSLFVQDNEVWLTQNQLAELFDTSVQNVGTHIKNILQDNELDLFSVIKDFFITAQDGKVGLIVLLKIMVLMFWLVAVIAYASR